MQRQTEVARHVARVIAQRHYPQQHQPLQVVRQPLAQQIEELLVHQALFDLGGHVGDVGRLGPWIVAGL